MVEGSPAGRALVTGANGLIGANLIRVLLARGFAVRAYVRPSADRRSLAGLGVDIAVGNVLDRDQLTRAAEGCDLLFHTASIYAYHGYDTGALEAVAVQGALNAVDAARAAECRRVVLTGSSVIFGSSTRTIPRSEDAGIAGDPDVPYFVAKSRQAKAALQHAAERGVDLVLTCPTVTVGPHDYRLGPSNANIVTYLKDPFRTTFPGGCNIAAAEDVALGHVLLAERGNPGHSYLLGGENLEWSLIHRVISELCGTSGPLVYGNRTSSYLTAAALELAARLTRTEPISTRVQAGMVGRYYWYSHEKAAALGYAPRPARLALASAIAWLITSGQLPRHVTSRFRLSAELFADHSLPE